MKIRICLNWSANGYRQNMLFKNVSMPCLPPVGTILVLREDGGYLDHLKVILVQWAEEEPDIWDVFLEEMKLEDPEPVGGNLEWLKSLGWNQGLVEDAQGV